LSIGLLKIFSKATEVAVGGIVDRDLTIAFVGTIVFGFVPDGILHKQQTKQKKLIQCDICATTE